MNATIRKSLRILAGFALALSGIAGTCVAADDEGKSRAETGALKPCVECHEGHYSITRTKHFVTGDPRTPAGKAGAADDTACAGCHGDTLAHQKTPRVKGLIPVAFGKKNPVGPQNEACLNCHQAGARIHWQGSGHERSQQACANCHRLHAPKDPVLVAETQASVCFDCHKDRRAEMHRISNHPTRAGFFACSSCHAAHGSTTRASLQKNSVNETCYTCHAQFRGPYLWEHRSAQDDCTNCHSPHGTNNPPMLKVRMPYLCQQCHQDATTNHSNIAFGANSLPGGTNAGNAQRIVGNSCTNCHMKIHGSNHPSGARLQR